MKPKYPDIDAATARAHATVAFHETARSLLERDLRATASLLELDGQGRPEAVDDDFTGGEADVEFRLEPHRYVQVLFLESGRGTTFGNLLVNRGTLMLNQPRARLHQYVLVLDARTRGAFPELVRDDVKINFMVYVLFELPAESLLEHPTLAPFAILPGRDRSDVRSAQEIEHVIRASRHPDADELVAAIPVLARLP